MDQRPHRFNVRSGPVLISMGLSSLPPLWDFRGLSQRTLAQVLSELRLPKIIPTGPLASGLSLGQRIYLFWACR